MNVLLVTLDLNPGGNQSQVRSLLEQYDAMRFSENAYALHIGEGPEAIYERLQPLLGKDDLAYVFTITKPWIGYGYEAMNDWLERNL